ncbi:exonuclease 1 [Rhinophrynus dorsalis]
MGIHGLLQFLKEASEPIHVKKYKGQAVAVDTYCWLHKGAFACAEKLAKGEPTDQYVSYCMKFVHMLLSFGVKPILVFDGCTLPSKKDVEKARREKRQTNLQKGKQLLREGKVSEARDCFSRSVNITCSMAHEVIKAARAEGVDCIVAPYEADSQLAYLNKNDFAQAIITEDSDLLAFGCKKVILKMDKFGNGLEIDQARLGMCKPLGDVFTEEKFRYMCILSGCDYLPSIHGIGLAKACKLLKIANNPDIIKVIKKIGQYLKSNITVPDGYIEGFVRANNTFLYQLVFDPVERKLVPLNPYGDDVVPAELSYAGPNIGDSAAFQIAIGNTDVNTMEQIDDYNPDCPQLSQHRSHSWNNKQSNQNASHSESIWHTKYVPTETPRMEEKKSTRGIILTSTKHAVKRPHEDGISDVDLFNQYSFSKSKKARKECSDNLEQQSPASGLTVLKPLDDSANVKELKSQVKVRNKFATVLQRRNDDCVSPSVTGTRSRFFYNPADNIANSSGMEDAEKETMGNDCVIEVKQESSLLTESDYEKPKKVESLSPKEECGLNVVQASPQQTQRRCFSWSGTLSNGNARTPNQSPALLSLRKFQRAKPLLQPDRENRPSSPNEKQGACGKLESTYFQRNSNGSSPEKQNNLSALDKEDSVSDVPGLRKTKSVGSGLGSKLKPAAPAKVSGLSSRGHTKPACNNENAPGLQATISDLWKNFSFKKH